MRDLIDRQDAIDAFDCTNELIVGGEANAQNVVNYINKVVGKIKNLPSAEPEILACGEGELNVPGTNVGDMISRQAAIDAVNAYLGLSSVSRTIQNMTNLQEILEKLPSAESEIPEKLYPFICYITDAEGLQHEVVHIDDLARVTGWWFF